jgi:hypothetical protein
MPSSSVLLIFMMINGQPSGPTFSLQALTPGCAGELAAIAGINSASEPTGIFYQASCEKAPKSTNLIHRNIL